MFAHIVLLVGSIITIIGWFQFIVAAKKISMAWFIGCLIIGLVWPFFLLTHFSQARRPFTIFLVGLIIAGVGSMMVVKEH